MSWEIIVRDVGKHKEKLAVEFFWGGLSDKLTNI